MIGLAQQGTSTLPGLASVTDLGDSNDDLPLLVDVAAHSSVVMRAPSNPIFHSLHDQSSRVEFIVDTYDQ